ncbi:MAG TPA: FAD-binding oxidoreductase, partial [Stellaceae bacterium]|nr:FAD-binding oxidoreductase [Stellaceae bacterium]
MTNRHEDAMVQGSWYEASVTREPDDPVLTGEASADVCIVGAGYAGLSAALELRRRGLSVIVLEAHRPGWGASGRNGGQVLAGYANDEEMVRQLGAERARAAWDLSVEGIDLLRRRIEEHHIDCEFVPGYLHAATSPRKAAELGRWVDRLRRDFAYESVSMVEAAATRQWIDSP